MYKRKCFSARPINFPFNFLVSLGNLISLVNVQRQTTFFIRYKKLTRRSYHNAYLFINTTTTIITNNYFPLFTSNLETYRVLVVTVLIQNSVKIGIYIYIYKSCNLQTFKAKILIHILHTPLLNLNIFHAAHFFAIIQFLMNNIDV